MLEMCVYDLQLQVVAIKLKESHLLDNISDQRCVANFKPKVNGQSLISWSC